MLTLRDGCDYGNEVGACGGCVVLHRCWVHCMKHVEGMGPRDELKRYSIDNVTVSVYVSTSGAVLVVSI